MKISKDRAIELVEALLARRQEENPVGPRMVIIGVNETAVGWLIARQSDEYRRNPIPMNMLVGHGPYLVDGDDGAIYEIPGETLRTSDWQTIFLQQFRGSRRPDPILSSVRAILQSEGHVPAMRYLRRNAPSLGISEAKTYISAIQDGGDPPHELLQLTREADSCPPLPIRRVTGPAI
ncbi:YrhB domain-containing protein [Kitasatospora sp. NPDC003701]